MASRDDILRAVRSQPIPPVDLPSLDQAWITFPDRARQFATVLESVGGRCIFVPDLAAVQSEISELPVFTSAKKIISLVPEITGANVDLNTLTDPHQVEDIDFAIAPGQFGVAENGAIWVTDQDIKHRVVYFLVQHLSLVIQRDSIVHNMHEAYTCLRFTDPRFGVFISGPSKTADIEQSLVIGAHGPRSLTVFCVGK